MTLSCGRPSGVNRHGKKVSVINHYASNPATDEPKSSDKYHQSGYSSKSR